MDSSRRLPIDRHGHDVSFDRADRRQEISAPRRRWAPEDKAAVIRESLTPGADLAAVARKWKINRGQLRRWQREAALESSAEGPAFVPIRLADDTAICQDAAQEALAAAPVQMSNEPAMGTIEIEAGDVRVRVSGCVDLPVLRAVLSHVRWRP